MVNKKIKMNEKNADGTFNILHPETTIEQVINPNGENIVEHFSDKTKKHIEIVDALPSSLDGKGVFFKKTGSNGIIPTVPTKPEISAESIGIIPNDPNSAQNNITKLNSYLGAHSEISIKFGDNKYHFSNTIALQNENALLGTHNSVLLLTVTDKDFIDFNPMCRLENMRLYVPDGFNKIVIKIHNKDFMTPLWSKGFISSIKDIFIYANQGGASKGISIVSESGYNVTGLSIQKIYITHCETGIEILNIGDGWSNGIFCDDIYFLACKYGIHNTGDGNRFVYTFQYRLPEYATDDKAIICGGDYNNFTGMIWDLPRQDMTSILFKGESEYNIVSGMGFSVEYVINYIEDYGKNNSYLTGNDDYAYNPQIPANYTYDLDNKWRVPRWTNFKGLYSNILWNARNFATVNVELGDSELWYGGLDDLFTMNKIMLSPATVSKPIVVEIILPETYTGIPEIGITFTNGAIPKNVKIECAWGLEYEYETLVEKTNNKDSCVRTLISMYGASIAKVKITMSEGIYHELINPSRVISVGCIYMYSNMLMGNYYLNAHGGDVYGGLNMNKNIIKNKVWENGITTSRPSNPVPFQEFFDTTLNKPIWRNATNTNWIDANGSTV